MLAAAGRAPAGKGSCAIRCAEDCPGDSWRQFGHDRLCHASRTRADAWSGIAAGLSSFRGLEQKEYDSSDGDASLPMVHRVISNFKAYVEGAFHGLSKKHLQSYADSYSWRYSHRSSSDACMELLHEMCLMHVPLSGIAATAKASSSSQRTISDRWNACPPAVLSSPQRIRTTAISNSAVQAHRTTCAANISAPSTLADRKSRYTSRRARLKSELPSIGLATRSLKSARARFGMNGATADSDLLDRPPS